MVDLPEPALPLAQMTFFIASAVDHLLHFREAAALALS